MKKFFLLLILGSILSTSLFAQSRTFSISGHTGLAFTGLNIENDFNENTRVSLSIESIMGILTGYSFNLNSFELIDLYVDNLVYTYNLNNQNNLQLRLGGGLTYVMDNEELILLPAAKIGIDGKLNTHNSIFINTRIFLALLNYDFIDKDFSIETDSTLLYNPLMPLTIGYRYTF